MKKPVLCLSLLFFGQLNSQVNFEWMNPVKYAQNTEVTSLACDPGGNIFMGGNLWGSYKDTWTGSFVTMLNHNGITSWIDTLKVDSGSEFYSMMTLDQNGGCYVLNRNGFAKYTNWGVQQWLHPYLYPQPDNTMKEFFAKKITVKGTDLYLSGLGIYKFDTDGNFKNASTGYFSSTDLHLDGQDNSYIFTNITYPQANMQKRDTSLVPVWSRNISACGEMNHLTTDDAGRIYMLAISQSTSELVLLDTDGNEMWRAAKNYMGHAIYRDAGGDIYTAGVRVETSVPRTIVVEKHNMSGTLLWSWERTDTTGEDYYSVTSITNSGHAVYVTGYKQKEVIESFIIKLYDQDNVTSLGKRNKESIKISPNPSGGKFSIGGLKGEKSVLSITGTDGKLIQKKIIESMSTEVDLSSQPHGIYFLMLQDKEGVHYAKIVRE